MNKSKLIYFTLFLFIGFQSCKKDKDDPPAQAGYPPSGNMEEPTPYNLEIPPHFSLVFAPTIPADNPLTVEGIALGKKLFFERRLSINNQLSCAGCHRPEFGFNDLGKSVSLGAQGQSGVRNAMPLFNLAWVLSYTAFNWNGSAKTLEEQAFNPVINHMEMMETWPNVEAKLQNDPVYPRMFEAAFKTSIIDSNLIVKAIAQFERTLISGDSRMDKYMQQLIGLNPPGGPFLNAQELRGFNIYVSTAKGDCFHCHGNSNLRNPLWTDNEFRNNGLDMAPDSGLASVTKRAADLGKFKTPSLRNLVYTAPYMHDGRFQTLEDVVEFYSTGVQDSPQVDALMRDRGTLNANLTTVEKADLVAFLKTITDSSFVSNPAFRP